MGAAGQRSIPPFRFEPPAPPAWEIRRPRLLARLTERFERRVVTVTAGAGYGKSVLLARALAENRLDPIGEDIWLRIDAHDRQPARLIAGLAGALSGAGEHAGNATFDDVVDLVWNRSPSRVAIVLDDVHKLADSTESWDVIGALLDALPANASVVLSGRRPPPVKLSKLRAAGDVVGIGQAELAFTDEEAWLAARSILGADPPAGALARWPALTALACQAGHHAGIDYLWEEVIAELDDDRRGALAIASRFSALDDRLLAAIAPESPWTTADLLDGLPLVETDDRILFRLHDMWSSALAGEVDDRRLRDAARRAAERLVDDDDLVRAGEAYRLAGDLDGLRKVVRRCVLRPLGSSLDNAEAASLLALLPADLEAGSPGELLRTTLLLTSAPNDSADGYRRAIAAARAEGDELDEVVGHWRLAQIASSTGGSDDVPDRLVELAERGHDLAITACAMLRSAAATRAGDVTTALAELENFRLIEPRARYGSLASRYLSLGRPELVPAQLDAVLADGVSDSLAAQALWIRGEVPPDIAWPIARELPARYRRRNVRSLRIPLAAFVAQVAVAVGELNAARHLIDSVADDAAMLSTEDRLFLRSAEVTWLVATGDEVAAVDLLRRLDREVPILPFPAWPYLSITGIIRALLPECGALDAASLGPALTTSRAAGAALAALRSTGDHSAAARLPWTQLDLLRVHLPARLLVELAVAAGTTDSLAALAVLPGAALTLTALGEQPDPTVRQRVERLRARYPHRPSRPLAVTTLGRFTVLAPDGARLVDATTRPRVAELMQRLVHGAELDRATAAAAMWPDLPLSKARENLRATLTHLNRALRVADQPEYLRVSATEIILDRDLVATDAADFDRIAGEARWFDANSSPSAALDSHRRAVALYGGDYLGDLDDDGVHLERIRLESLAHESMCRAAELLGARGEPEAALDLATRAMGLDQYSQRALRAALSCCAAMESPAAARQLLHRSLERWREAGIDVEPATAATIDRLRLR